MVTYEHRTAPVNVSLDDVANDGESGEHDNAIGVEAILGGSGDDRLELDNEEPGLNYAAFGEKGDDTLIGGSGRDELDGYDGNDTLTGNGGPDFLFAGFGDDTVFARDGIADLGVFCESGNDQAQIDAGLELRVASCETLLP
jgi:Ca2+-binding RTX toxin-like protein